MKLLTIFLLTVFFVIASYGAGVTTKHTGDVVEIGSNTAVSKRIVLKRGSNNPEIRWNESSGNIEFSNDGSSYSALGSGAGGAKNYAYNASFRWFQRTGIAASSAINDGNYGPDRWKVLSSGGGSQTKISYFPEVVSGSVGSTTSGWYKQDDATDRRFGTFQCLPHSRTLDLPSKVVNFSFYARSPGTEIPNIRAAIVEWTGTEDAPTFDPVSSWAATPTLVADYNYVNTPADIPLTASMAQYTVTGTMAASHANVCLFVWTPSAEQQDDDLFLTQIQLTKGTTPQTWADIALSEDQDRDEVRRFYQKTAAMDDAPFASGTDSAWFQKYSDPGLSNVFFAPAQLTPIMWRNPGICGIFSTSGSPSQGFYRDGSGGGSDKAGTASCTGGAHIQLSTSTAPTTAGATISCKWEADAEFY